MNKETKIIVSIAVAFLVIFGLIIYFTPKASPSGSSDAAPADSALLVRPTSRMTGSPTAKVTLVEFGDFQCPACGQFHPLLKAVIAAYDGNPNFNFVFRNFPLPQHKNAVPASEAAEAAGAQGKYWEMYNMLYENQREWSESGKAAEIFAGYATRIGLDVARFTKDLAEHAYLAQINADQADATALKLDHTPTIFVNGIESKSYSLDAFKAEIDAALAK